MYNFNSITSWTFFCTSIFSPILSQLKKLINVVFTWHIMPFRFNSILCYCSDFSFSCCCYPPSSTAQSLAFVSVECVCKFVSMLGGSFHNLDFCMPSMFMLSYFVVYIFPNQSWMLHICQKHTSRITLHKLLLRVLY